MQKQTLNAGTGQVVLRVYDSSGPTRASVVIGGAMGVRQDYYTPFAEWLSSMAFASPPLTTVVRAIHGPTRPDGGLRGFKADLFDWACDYEAVVDAAKAALPDAPL